MPDETPLSRPQRVGNWIACHRVALTATGTFVATATVLTKMRFGAQDQMIEFLTQEGLMEKYIEKYPVITK